MKTIKRLVNYFILGLKTISTPEFCSCLTFQYQSTPFIIRFLFCQVFVILLLCIVMYCDIIILKVLGDD